MKKPLVTFAKHYTRDTALILQQLWRLAMEEGIESLGIPRRHAPVVVDYTVDGVCEIWENDKAINYIKARFAAMCQKEPKRALLLLEWFQKGVRKLEPAWKKGKLNDLSALKRFISEVRKYMIGDMFISYVGVDGRVKGRIKELAARLRAQDYYFVYSNQVIVNSLKNIFPRAKDYVEVLCLEDLDAVPPLKELCRRFHNYVSVSDGYAKIETLKTYARKYSYIFREEKARKIGRGIVGIAANLGRAIGHARLVYSRRDLNKVKSGDIVISPMTTADMMPALRRAAAIVTDEGGVICHAAIIARELGKPCLIATRTATTTFKDGDWIEVDTYKQTVRRFK